MTASPAAFRQEHDPDGILLLTLDVPGEKVNTLNPALMTELGEVLSELTPRVDVRGVVFRSGKPDSFIAGANLEDVRKIKSATEGETLSRDAQAILDRLERLGSPVVAAIHGACLGGGLETALACRYRIATDDPRTALGLPEVMLGLIPGAGGTRRLPRLVGLATALDLILTGRTVKAARALKLGLVDEVVPEPALLLAARKAALALSDGTLAPRRRGLRPMDRLLRPLILRKARVSALAKSGGHYPAPLRAIDAVAAGSATTGESGPAVEARLFGELAVSEVSRALVSVFFATQGAKKDAGVPEDTLARDVRKLAVVGAGLMGAGIASASADAGTPVRLKDTSIEALGRGLRQAREIFEERRRRGGLTERDVQKRMDRLSPTLEYTGLRRADLVIEAVLEDLDLKRAVLAGVEAATSEECVYASNTSSLPIHEIAKGCRRPTRVLGMHFFSPVHRMPLLEVVVTADTDAWATATAVAFGRRLGKHVIVVRDGAGFYTTRTLGPYLNEAARLVEEGATIESVDAAQEAFGFPVGPLALIDEVGLDVAAEVSGVLHRHFGPRMAPPEGLARVHESGRLGRKNRHGFYAYNGKKKVDADVYAHLGSGAERRPFDPREIQDRLVFAFLNEAVLALQEGVLRSPRDGDIGAIFGLGFPPFLGGPFRYLDHLGARFACQVLQRLAVQHGERFKPAALLVEMAESETRFHPGSEAGRS